MAEKGKSARSTLTVCGPVELVRQRWQAASGGGVVPADAALEEAAEGLATTGVSELCCRVSMDSASFTRAAEVLLKAASLRISDEKLRQIAEGEGGLVQRAVEEEQLLLNFQASDCQATTKRGEPTTRVYLGCDGVKVPVITDAEKQKRFDKARQRRRKLGRQSKGMPPRPRLTRRRGADQAFKEFKIVTFYDQSRRRRLVSLTRKDHRQAGKLMRRGACLLKLRAAQERPAIVDGASWIAHRIDDSGVPVQATCLDFYHFSENVHKARREIFGETAEAGKVWVGQVLHVARHEGYEAMWEQLAQTRSQHRGQRARAGIDRLMRYVAERREMIRYVEFEQKGWDIGSGPTESQCKATTRRVKGRGMRWEPKNAEAMMALEALYQSGAWDKWWSTRHLLKS